MKQSVFKIDDSAVEVVSSPVTVEAAAIGGIQAKEKNAGFLNGNEWLTKNPDGLTDNFNEQCETPNQGEESLKPYTHSDW
jgi:hypothetical protein